MKKRGAGRIYRPVNIFNDAQEAENWLKSESMWRKCGADKLCTNGWTVKIFGCNRIKLNAKQQCSASLKLVFLSDGKVGAHLFGEHTHSILDQKDQSCVSMNPEMIKRIREYLEVGVDRPKK